jgi:signal transduction histidine kinase
MPPGLFETQHRRRDGSAYDAEVSSHLVVLDGRKYLYCSVRNVTERKRAAEERAALERQLRQALKMEAVGQLTGGVAHDFNNLLAFLIGHLQLIEEDTQGQPTIREWVRTCLKVVDRGATLTRSLLAFSRRQTLVPVEIDLNAIVNDMAEIMKRTLGEAIEIELTSAPDLWRSEADPGQLQNALLNLALNARDAMPDGGKLIVETRNTHLDANYAARHTDVKPGDFVVLAVSDTGIGMPPDVLERVFEPFFTTKDTGKGSGLGLSMVHGFVNQSGGHIDIESEAGRGTMVRIYLPRLTPDVTSEEAKTDRALKRGRETILLVEDNAELRALTQLQLKRLGYTVLTAGHAEAGLALLRDHPEVDLLLTDIVLPGGIDGIQLADQAVAQHPTLEVTFMTGYTHIPFEGLSAKPGRLLQKPFHSADLSSMIRAALDRD